jgi:Na+/H+ antiporter NhaD/arsenite permease-like protein
MSDQLVVICTFIAVFAGILSEALDKTLIVMAAAIFLILSGYISFEDAIHAIDFDTICLLLGMMILVDAVRHVGIFDWVTIQLGLYTRGNPVLIFILVGCATALFSAFLDNVTTVLVVVPLIISITQSIGLDPKIYILAVVFLSNIGGAATLIGDPPNIIIGSQVPGLTFGSFIQYLTVPVLFSCLTTFVYMRLANRDLIKSRVKNFSWLFMSNLMLEELKQKSKEINIAPSVMLRTGVIFGLVLLGFFTHAITHIEPAVIALTGAVVMLIAFRNKTDVHHLFSKLEWPTLIFFAGLFMVVGALEHVGALEMLSHWLVTVTTDLWLLLMIVLWSSAILSAIVDNIPFVAVMIPVLKDLLESGPFASDPKSGLLWWALALGACFGGNGSMIGASANVVSCAIADSSGIKIGFRDFLKHSLPVTFLSIMVASIYLTILYYW